MQLWEDSRRERLEGRGFEMKRTIEFLEHSLDRTGTAAAGHGDVEVICVFRHSKYRPLIDDSELVMLVLAFLLDL